MATIKKNLNVGMWSDGTNERAEKMKKFFQRLVGVESFWCSFTDNHGFYYWDGHDISANKDIPEGYKEVNPIKAKPEPKPKAAAKAKVVKPVEVIEAFHIQNNREGNELEGYFKSLGLTTAMWNFNGTGDFYYYADGRKVRAEALRNLPTPHKIIEWSNKARELKEVKQPKTTTSMKDLKEFGVKASSFALYKAFKEEAEAKGWNYLTKFNPFTPAKAEGESRQLWFAAGPTMWSSYAEKQTMGFSLTGGKTTFNLPQDWDAAIEALNVKVEPESILTHIADTDHEFKCDAFDIEVFKTGILKCGCQTYSKKDSIELLSAIKNLYETKIFKSKDRSDVVFQFMGRIFTAGELAQLFKNYEDFVGVKL